MSVYVLGQLKVVISGEFRYTYLCEGRTEQRGCFLATYDYSSDQRHSYTIQDFLFPPDTPSVSLLSVIKVLSMKLVHSLLEGK